MKEFLELEIWKRPSAFSSQEFLKLGQLDPYLTSYREIKLLEKTGRGVSFSSEDPGDRRSRRGKAQGWR